ncbi:hypothetical protein BDW69DRAFT_187603 [Aspergillus filifer]
MPQHHSHSHSISYTNTYTNTSSSLSSFTSTSTSPTPSSLAASTALARNSSTYRLKRWLSNRVRLPLRLSPAVARQSSSATASGTNNRAARRNRNSHHDIYNQKVSYPSECAYTAYTNSDSRSDLASQMDSIPNEHGSGYEYEQGNEQNHTLTGNHFRSFDYDYEYDAANTITYRHRTAPEAQVQVQVQAESGLEDEDDLTLSDNYAAYCRAFTASPTLFHRSQARPLPCLPPSDPESYDDFQKGGSNPNADPAYDNHQSRESTSDAHLNPYMSTQADESQIGFLPVGAHGYHPAQWGRVPSPPPGILTPARYEAIQMLERERMETEKMKRRKRFPTWCMPIRLSVWPWGRSKQC